MSQVHSLPFAQVPEWVLDAEISDRAVRLFCILHRYADTEGRAFPGRKVIAERLKCSVDSVDRAMNELVLLTAVHVDAEFRKDGSQTSNSYWLWPLLPTTVPDTQPQDCGPPAAKARPPRREAAAPYRKESQRTDTQRTEKPSSQSDFQRDLAERQRVERNRNQAGNPMVTDWARVLRFASQGQHRWSENPGLSPVARAAAIQCAQIIRSSTTDTARVAFYETWKQITAEGLTGMRESVA